MSASIRSHFLAIADFSSMIKEVSRLFPEVLMVCDHQKLTGQEMFAIHGCKLQSNASKEWSGIKVDFSKKVAKAKGGTH